MGSVHRKSGPVNEFNLVVTVLTHVHASPDLSVNKDRYQVRTVTSNGSDIVGEIRKGEGFI